MASPPAWTPGYRVQACRSGESAIAAEALMNIAGSGETQHGTDARVSSNGRRWGREVVRSKNLLRWLARARKKCRRGASTVECKSHLVLSWHS